MQAGRRGDPMEEDGPQYPPDNKVANIDEESEIMDEYEMQSRKRKTDENSHLDMA